MNYDEKTYIARVGCRAPSNRHAWAITNYGRLFTIQPSRKAAIRYVEEQTGKPWCVAQKYMEVWKCRVDPR